jgi:hypothetical protein
MTGNMIGIKKETLLFSPVAALKKPGTQHPGKRINKNLAKALLVRIGFIGYS